MVRETLLTGWNFMRWLRLGLGVFIGIQAIQMHHPISGFIAAFFIFQAVTNTECCGVTNCSAPSIKTNIDKIEELEYEEIQVKSISQGETKLK
ncbi:MAG: hypothetical protein ACKVQB_01265 [Bacteroidia bacterium]